MSKIVSHIKTVISIMEKEANASKGFNAMIKLKELDPVASFFGVTKREAIVFCALYYLSLTKNNVSPSDVANFISGSPYDMPKVVSQLDKLQKNKLIDKLWIDPFEYQIELTESVEYLAEKGMHVSIYNTPLCVLPEQVWSYARKSISDWKNDYLPECGSCKMFNDCGGFFKWNIKKRSEHIKPFH